MNNIMPPSRHGRQPGEPWTVESLVAELVWLQNVDDAWDDAVQRRIIALEEALVSRKARRRLRRQVRESADTFAWVGRDFMWRRLEAVFNQYLCEMAERERRSAA